MMRFSPLTTALISFLVLSGCDGASFSNESSRTLGFGDAKGQSEDAKAASQGEDKNDGTGADGAGDLPAEEEKAIEESCGKDEFGEVIRMNGNQEVRSMVLSKSTLIIMNGNQPKLSIEGIEGTVERVCIYMRGNQAQLSMAVNEDIGSVIVLQRGNETKAEIHVEASITALSWDAAGNQNQLTIDGAGSYTCPADVSSGNGNVLSCKTP